MKKKWLWIFNIIMMICIVGNAVCLGVFLHDRKSLERKNAQHNQNVLKADVIDTGAGSAETSEKGGAIYLETGNTLYLNKGATISGHANRYGSAIYVSKGAKLILDGGIITGNSGKYGAIYVEAGGELELRKGLVTGNYSQYGYQGDNPVEDYGVYFEDVSTGLVLADGVNYSDVIHDNEWKLYEYEIHYFVDGSETNKVYQSPENNALLLEGAPLDYENCNGYFAEATGETNLGYVDSAEEGMEIVVVNPPIKLAQANENLVGTTSYINNKIYTDRTGVINLHTRKVTSEHKNKLTFTSSSSKYIVKAKNSSISGEVVVPRQYLGKDVYQVASSGFNSKTAITSVYLPATIRTIDSNGFSGCSNLFYINLAQGLEKINGSAFSQCDKVSSVKYDHNKANDDSNDNWSSIIFPESLKSVAHSAYYSCDNIANVIVSSTLETFNPGVFYFSSKITSVIVNSDENSKYVGSINGDGENVIIDKTSNSLVFGCQTSIIPEGVETIVANAFLGQEDVSIVNIPASVTNIQTDAFLYARNITTLTVNDNNSVYTSKDENGSQVNAVIKMSENKLVVGSKGTTSIPSTVTTIGTRSFFGNKIYRITIPSNVTTIENSAFGSCSNLSYLTFNEGVETIGESAFYGCTKIASVTMPSSVTSIGSSAFYNCSALATLTLNTGLTSIGNSAFSGCQKIENLTIPSSVTSIGNSAFYGNVSLTTLVVPSSVTSIGVNAFQNCSKISTLTFGAKVITLSSTVFSGCSGITTLTITGSLINTDEQLFGGCKNVETLSVSTELSTYGAFWYLEKLKTLYVNTPTIGNRAFAYCSNLSKVTIGGGVTSIVSNVGTYPSFEGCSKITELAINKRGDVNYAHKTYFNNLPSLTDLTLLCNAPSVVGADLDGDGVIEENEIDENKSSFSGLSKLTNVSMGSWGYSDGQTIGEAAFAFCKNLQKVELLYCTSIGIGAFMLYSSDDIALNEKGEKVAFRVVQSEGTEKITDIGNMAFCNRTNLTYFDLDDNPIKTIGVGAFMNSGIKGDSSVGDSVLNVNKSIETIGSYAFMGCGSLTSINLSKATKLKNINEFVFAGSGLSEFIVPKCVDNIYVFAFLNCTNLNKIVIPNDVDYIDVKSRDDIPNVEEYAKNGLVGGTVTGVIGGLILKFGLGGATAGGVFGAVAGVIVGVVGGLILYNAVKYSPFRGCTNLTIYANKGWDYGWTFWGDNVWDCYTEQSFNESTYY